MKRGTERSGGPGSFRRAARATGAAVRPPRGMTLLEIMVVIVIIGILMTIGVGVWLRFRKSSVEIEAYQRLAAACRRARVFALEEGAESSLVLAPDRRSFHAEGLRLVGLWHLEHSAGKRAAGFDASTGFAGRDLQFHGGRRDVGYRGDGLRFSDGGRILLEDAEFRFPAGGQVSFWLLPDRDSAAERLKQTLLARGKELSLVINIEGRLEARSGSAVLITRDYRLAVRRWSRVTFAFSPEELTIAVDGAVRARAPGDLPSAKEDGLPLVLCAAEDGQFPFDGVIDEIALRRMVREPEFRLGARLLMDSPLDRVRFDAAGMLDRRWHNGPARIVLSAPDVEKPGGLSSRAVSVSLTGEIREER